MPKPKWPSPALVVACLALAVSLGGVSYAAVKLPRNSVGSPQVKPNSLKGADIRESSLAGVVLGKGQARAGSRTLAGATAFTPVLSVPGVGRIDADCASGGAASNHRFVNTAAANALTWVERGEPTTVFELVAPNGSSGPTSTSGDLLAFWFVRTEGARPRSTVIHVATAVDAGTCRVHAVAQRLTPG